MLSQGPSVPFLTTIVQLCVAARGQDERGGPPVEIVLLEERCSFYPVSTTRPTSDGCSASLTAGPA